MKLRQVLDLFQRQRTALSQILRTDTLEKPSDDVLKNAEVRWAFLVTLDEMNELVDDIKGNGNDLFAGPLLEPKFEEALRQGRAPLIIDGFAIFPELDLAQGKLNG